MKCKARIHKPQARASIPAMSESLARSMTRSTSATRSPQRRVKICSGLEKGPPYAVHSSGFAPSWSAVPRPHRARLASDRSAHRSPREPGHAPAHPRKVPPERPRAPLPQRNAARIHTGKSGNARSVSVVNRSFGHPGGEPAPFIHRLGWRYRRMSRLRVKPANPLDEMTVTH